MLEAQLSALFTPEAIESFRRMWAVSDKDAVAEGRRIVELLAEPQDRSEVENLVAKMVAGLVGERPDLSSWLEAIAAGSFELRETQDYAHSKNLKSRARFLSRQKPMYIGDIERHRRAWATEVDEMQDAVRLIAASALIKEMRKNVAAKAAIGPAWPLMVAVNDHFSADEKRLLHHFGADNRLIRLISTVTRWALKRFSRKHSHNSAKMENSSADWKRALPPGVDIHAYFSENKDKYSEKYTHGSFGAISTIEEIFNGPRPSFLDESKTSISKYGLPMRIQILLWGHGISKESRSKLIFENAVKAIARERHRVKCFNDDPSIIHSENFKIQVWIKHWVEKGGGIPELLPVHYLSYMQEEACRMFESEGKNWSGYEKWRSYGVIIDEPTRTLPETWPPEFWDEEEPFHWVSAPRKIDRIDVSVIGVS